MQEKPAVAPDLARRVRVYYPTRATVLESEGGPLSASAQRLGMSAYAALRAPRAHLHNHRPVRGSALSHNKILLARGCMPDGRLLAWAYVGSANLTAAAWGTVRPDGALQVRNWESGIVIRVAAKHVADTGFNANGIPPLSVFEGIVPLPFHLASLPYSADNVPFTST
jgi:hypothetical protein